MTASLFPELDAQRHDVISLWQPWAVLWAAGVKRNETRHWPLPKQYHNRPLLIHAARRWTSDIIATCQSEPFATRLVELAPALAEREGVDVHMIKVNGVWVGMPMGCVVGWAWMIDSVFTHKEEPTFEERQFGDWTPGRYAWRAKDQYLLKRFVPARGRQQFFIYEGDL